jgi:hypothetical protein
MSRVLIICRQRLGDIVGCFPAARLLAQTGHEIDFHCFPQYHSIFRAVTYCRPVGPEALAHKSDYQRVYDLEITRSEYDAYRASRIKWRDYVYAKYEDLAPARNVPPHFDRMPSISDYHLPQRYALAAPFGISQVTLVNGDWFRKQCQALSSDPWYVLSDRPGRRIGWGTSLYARSLDHLPALIAGASTFVTINSSPNIIASGVRTSWYKVDEPGFSGQDNYESPGQTVLHQPPELARYSWRFWVHYWRRKLMGLDTSNDKGSERIN